MRVGEYILARRVASGATCDVYRGYHAVTGQAVAVKILIPSLCSDAQLSGRFLNEAQALQQLRHAHLVKAVTSGVLPTGQPFLILEWLPTDLHQVLTRAGGQLPVQTATHVAAQLGAVLAFLHESRIFHRDLKPANILVATDNLATIEVKLADLGLAKIPREAGHEGGMGPVAAVVSTASRALLGTWDYMAPEQWVQSKTAGGPADVYSLGVLLFQMLAGRLPFVAELQKDLMYLHLLEQPPFELLEGLAPHATRDLIAGMLRKKPLERPAMREIAQRLVDTPIM
ncbi:serine/threonine protein kinase [Corallococcus sp. H22C18031201]|nr:serine/threonine protein kinase [Corallococcus sp. H22C18031201]